MALLTSIINQSVLPQGAIFPYPVIIGLPSRLGPIPNVLIIQTLKQESVEISNNITMHPTPYGVPDDFQTPNPSRITCSVFFSKFFSFTGSDEQFLASSFNLLYGSIVGAYNTISSFKSSGSLGFPNFLPSLALDLINQSVSTLKGMCNTRQPLRIVGLPIDTTSIELNNPFLESFWYIDSVKGEKNLNESVTATISLVELYSGFGDNNNPSNSEIARRVLI